MTIVKALRAYARSKFPNYVFKGNTIAAIISEMRAAEKEESKDSQ